MKKEKTQIPSSLDELEGLLNEYFGIKAPQLPENVKEILVKFGPYITLAILFFSLPFILGVLGLGAVMSPFAMMGGARLGAGYMLGILVAVVSLVLEIVALPGLFKREIKSWRMLFWVSLVTAVGAIFRFDLGALVVGSIVSWYFLFQVRSYYK